MSKHKTSEALVLEAYRVALENVVNQPEVAAEMKELGYDDAKIAEGKNLFVATRNLYDFNKQEDDETTDASALFKNAQQTLHRTYMAHRKKAKIIFRDQPETLKRLKLTGDEPRAYIRWLEGVKTFYFALSSDDALLSQMKRLKVDDTQVATAQKQITDVEEKRVVYLREKGESQNATQKKDKALAEFDRWMSEFYAVARIALEDKPQLLEALGKVVK